MDEEPPIWKAIDRGGGQTCDVCGVLRELDKAGFAIVPKKPTEQMIVAGDEKIIDFLNDHAFSLKETTPAMAAWDAMIAALSPTESEKP